MSGPRKEPMKVAEALAGYLARSGLGDRLEQVGTLDDWSERVGPRIAAVTEPLHVANNILYVAVTSSAWLMELRMMENDIRGRLNDGREKGRIDSIRFVQQGGDDQEPASGRRKIGWGRKGR